jgi:tetratricopeptide (TPR) repeat protein
VQTALRRVAEEMTGLEEIPLTREEREHLIEMLQTGAKTYEEHMQLGDFRFFMGDFTLAAEEYRAATKADPDDPFALFALVHASFASGEYRTAGRYLARALAREPNWGLYEFRLQEFYGNREEYRRHVADLERLVQLRPDSADMKFLLAYVYYFSGRYADSADLLAEVLRLQPDFQYADHFLRLARLQG